MNDPQAVPRRTLDPRLWTLDLLRWGIGLLVVLWALLSTPAPAQYGGGAGGWSIQLYGMVQVEPGANVLTLGVKDEEIRFVVHDLRCSNRGFSMSRFLSDTSSRKPGVYMKGPDTLLDLLIKERPSKRVLRLTGFYYPESRIFTLSHVEPFHEKSRKEF